MFFGLKVVFFKEWFKDVVKESYLGCYIKIRFFSFILDLMSLNVRIVVYRILIIIVWFWEFLEKIDYLWDIKLGKYDLL